MFICVYKYTHTHTHTYIRNIYLCIYTVCSYLCFILSVNILLIHVHLCTPMFPHLSLYLKALLNDEWRALFLHSCIHERMGAQQTKALQPVEEESAEAAPAEPKVPEETKQERQVKGHRATNLPLRPAWPTSCAQDWWTNPTCLWRDCRQEVLEECGYDVPVTKLRKITSYRWEPILKKSHFWSYGKFISVIHT